MVGSFVINARRVLKTASIEKGSASQVENKSGRNLINRVGTFDPDPAHAQGLAPGPDEITRRT
jgi:hypothetical protein